MTPVLEKRRLRLEVIPADAWITVDKELFQSLLYNLIDNGMKPPARDKRSGFL